MDKLVPSWMYQFAYDTGATLGVRIAMLDRLLVTSLLSSVVFVLVLNTLSLTLGIDGFVDTIFVALLYLCVCMHLILLVLQKESIIALVELQSKAFRSFPDDTVESKTVGGFRRRVGIINSGMFIMLISSLGAFFICPVVSIFLSGKSILTIPLPFGKVPFIFTSFLEFGFYYLLSAIALLTAASMYTCWYVTFVFSSLHISTCLKILAFKVQKLDFELQPLLDDIPEELDISEHDFVRRLYVKKDANELLREILVDHVQIIRQVSLTEKIFRWVNLFYSQVALIVLALLSTILVNEWFEHGNILFKELNVLLGCLSTLLLTNNCGQEIIDESGNLEDSLYFINWVDKNPRFRKSLLIMLTVSNRHLRLTTGIYTLKRTSYNKIIEALSSYISFLIGMKNGSRKAP